MPAVVDLLVLGGRLIQVDLDQGIGHDEAPLRWKDISVALNTELVFSVASFSEIRWMTYARSQQMRGLQVYWTGRRKPVRMKHTPAWRSGKVRNHTALSPHERAWAAKPACAVRNHAAPRDSAPLHRQVTTDGRLVGIGCAFLQHEAALLDDQEAVGDFHGE